MEFSDIRAIISHAYNLHKGNCFETTRRSFRPSERNLYMLVFSKKENYRFYIYFIERNFYKAWIIFRTSLKGIHVAERG